MSSLVPLSYLDPALSFPNNTSLSRVQSHSSSAYAAELSSSPSIYVTFKVLQLVNQFRKRVQTRVRSTRGRSTKESSSRLTEDFCQAFEREAAEHIDYVLGKSRVNPRKTSYPDGARRSLQKPKVSKRSIKVATTAKPETESTAAKKIEWLLKVLDKSVKSETHSLSAVAKSHELFVERRDEFSVNHNSWKELLPQLVRVTNLLDTLRRAPSSRSGVKTFAESDEGVDLSFDENIVANLEHLLLCLKERLIRLLIAELRELVQTHIIECQRNQKQHTKELVLEFPDGRHPLSTTWPWSIRPSLAVIWGVCWMFYAYFFDEQGNIFDDQGNMRHQDGTILLTAEDFEQAQAQAQNQNQRQQDYSPASQPQQYQQQQAQNNQQQQHQQYYQGNNFGQDFRPQSAASDHSAVPRTMLAARHSPSMMAQPHSHPQLMYGGGQTVAASHPPFASDQAAHAVGGPTGFHTNNAFSAAPPASYVAAPPDAVTSNSLPEDFLQHLHYHSSPNTYGADQSGPWMPPNTAPGQQQPGNYFLHASLPPQSGIPPQPNLRVDTSNFSGFEPHQPQEYLSATPVSATSSNPGATYGQYLSPQNARARVPQMNTSDQPDQPYTTPKSESPIPQAMTAYQHSRKRSHDAMTEGGQGHPHSRNGSRAGSEGYPQHPPSGEEDSPGRQRLNTAVQRPDPPTNKDGKFICNHSPECDGHVFDRKCEWNKHMDKHDRPYRCSHPDCAKLQGFTYSGGLLRHEREVHNKHGGPKSQLMCTYPDCKRKNKGFTRKENLNEHIRRVHSKESQSQPSMKRDGTDASAIAGALQEDAETPASRYSESGIDHEDSLISPTHQQPKRRRLNSNLGDVTEVESLRQENDVLRSQLAELSSRVQQLQDMVQPAQHLPQGGQQGAPGQG